MLLTTVDSATRLSEPVGQVTTCQTTLVILDAGVDNLPSLRADLPENANTLVLDATRDGIEQITEALATYNKTNQPITSLHLVSHGEPGCLHLGNVKLSIATLSYYESQLRKWANVLNGADLLLYGCQVGEGVFGTFFLQQLQQLTGANIAASDQRVGLVNGKPNWKLDTQLGTVKTDVIFSEALQRSYEGSFVEVSFDIEQDVAIETEGTLVTFRFTLDEAPPPEGTVVVLSANETSSINRFDPGFGGSNLQLNGIDPFLPNNDISPGFIFDAFALNITQQNASFSIPLFNTPNDVSVDNPNTNPAIEDAADVAEEITWSISTIAPGDAANLGLGTPGTVSAGAGSDTITIADNPDQLSPSVPEVSITSDITELVEDEGTVVTFTISASEAPPSGGINITLDTAKTLGLADFDVFASSFAGDLGFVTAPPGNESLVLRLSGLSGSVSVPIFDDQDRTEDGTQSDPNGPLRNDDIGEEQTTFTILEGDGYTVSPTAASITLTLKDTNVVNTAPVATDDSFTVDEDTVLTGDVSGNDTNTEGDASYALDADAANGTVALADDGSFTYTPDANFNGTDSFTYTLSDAEFSSTATVNITVDDVIDNTAPVATDDSFTVDEDTVLTGDVSGNDTDTEGDASYALDADAANGTVALADDGSFTYTPDANFNGTDSFIYTLSDAEFSSTATVNITVDDVIDNTAPVATDDSFTVEEDTVLTGDVSGNDTDTEGDASYALDAGAANGTVALTDDGSFTYTPDADFNGTDSFTYTLSDAEFSSTATVNITVDDVVDNIAPVAVGDSFSTDEDTPVSGDVSTNDSDPNGDALTYSVTGDVSNGTLNFNADGSFDYTPNADFNGTDSFTYEVSDGELTSTATAEIAIAPVDDIPVVSFSTTSGTLSEAAGDELVLNFSVAGDIPPEGITVNLEGDTAEILQQFLAPDGDGAVQTRVSDDGVNVFYRFDTSFGPGAGIEGGTLDVFSLEDGDPAEGSSDPDAAGTGFLSNFSFTITEANASITLPVSDDLVQEEDKTFTYTLADGAGYTVDAAQNSGTFTVTDGVVPATSPTVGVTSSETTLIEDEQTRTTITFTTDGDIPAEGLLVQLKGPVRSIAEFDVNGTNNTQPRDPEGELVVTGPVVTGGNIAGTDEVAGSVFFRITEPTSSIDVAVFDDDIAEGPENFTFSLVDGEAYEVDAANSGFDITIEDEPIIVPDPVVSFSTTSGTLSEATGDELVLSFAVDGVIPPVELDAEGNYVSGGIAVNLEGDMAEILQQFLAPDGDGAVQTRVSDDGVNVFYRFDTSFGPGAGLTGGILQVFSLEDGDPAEGSSDPAAAGTGFLSNFSFILTDANASITLPVSDDIVQEEDQTFSYTLVGGEGYEVDPAANSGTFTVTDGVVPATSPTVGVTSSETTLIEDEQTRTTITFTTDGDIPAEGLLVQLKGPVRSIAEFDVNGTNNTQPRDPEGELVVTGPVVTGGNIAGTDEVAGSVFFRITEATSSIDVAVFDDDIAEGTENFTFSLVDGEAYEVDAANSGFDITIEDESIVAPDPVVGVSISPSAVSEEDADTTVTTTFTVDGEIPTPEFDAEGNLIGGGLSVLFQGPLTGVLDEISGDFEFTNLAIGPFFDLQQGIFEIILFDNNATLDLTILNDVVQEEDQEFAFTLVENNGSISSTYAVDPDASTSAVTVTDGNGGPGVGPTVGLSFSKAEVSEGEEFTVNFSVDGEIPAEGLTVLVDSPTQGALGEFNIFDANGNPAFTTTGISGVPEVGDIGGSGFLVTLTDPNASITIFTFDDGPGEGAESLTFDLVDGEIYEVDPNVSSATLIINDDVPTTPVVSFSTTTGTISEAAGDELVLSFAVDGVIPPVELDAEGNYVSGGIAVNLEGDMAEILQQFLAPDGDGAVQTRVSDDGVNVFYRFDTSFGPGAGLTGGILQVFSLEDGDPAEGSSDPAAAGTGFLSNFSFILTDANASITLPVSDDIVQEEDQTFSYTLVDGDGYTVDAAQNSGTFTVTDGVTPATSPTVGVTSSETTLIEDEQTRTTITFTTDGDIPAEGLLVQLKGPVRSIAEFDVNGTNNTQPRDPEGELVVTGPVVTGGNIAGTDEVAGSVFFRITEATSSIDVAVFDDDIAEGTENFTFSLVDGEAYEVDAANSGFDITIEDEPIIVPDPVVSFTTSTDSLNEAEGTPITFNFSVEGEIPADGLVVRTADNFFPNPQLDFNLLDFSDPNVIDGIEFFAFEETGPGQFVIDWKITKPEAFIKVAVFDDNIAEADTSFTTGLLPGEGYTLNPEATTATVSVTDGVDGTGGPSVSLTADKTAVNEGDSLTLTFNVAGDIPDGGLEVVVDSETAGALGDFITTDEAGNPLLTFTGLSAAPAPNGDASGFIVNITESTATISLDIFDDGPGEGPETFDFQVLDGENYDVDAQAGGFAVTLNDEPVSGPPVVSFSTTSGTLSEADGSELVLNFSVAGDIPPEGITVNLEGDMAEILQQFLAPDGDGAVQTRVSDDGVNVFYRFDTSFGPGAGIEGGTLDVFSLEDGDPAEGSSDPAAAGAGFLSNFSFTITEANASITLPVSNDIVQEEDQTFSYTLVGGEGYEVDPAANSGTFTVTDGVVPATSPTVGVTSSETTLSEDDQTRTTITFTTDGDIPAEGLLVQLKGPVRSIAEFDVNGTNNTQPRDPEGELVVTGPVVTGGNIAGTDEVAGSVFFRITEATSSIDVAVFDDDIAEGTENFTFSLVDGEAYEVDAANSGFDITIEDESIAAPTLDIGLYDAQTDSLISTLTEGSELLLSDVLGKQLTIGALVPDDSALSGQVESAFLDLNNGQATRTENIEPYTLFGDFRGNFLGKNALFSVGDNSIVFDLYSQNRLRGDLLDTVTRNFTVVDDLADFPDLTIGLYDSRTDTLIKTLEQGTEILASEILGKQLTIGAFVPDDSPFSGAVESMFLDLNDGQATRTENIEPYTLFGDFSGNFLGRDSLLNEGANSIDFDLYSGNRLSGNLLSSVTRDFTVVDDLTGQDDLVVGLFDAENDSLITVLDGNTELQASDIAGKELSIGAFVPEESPFFNQAESMFLDLNDGQATRTENIEPYTLFGDFNGNVLGQSDLLQTGENNIEFDIYSQNRLRGELLGSVTRTITVVDDAI